MGAWLTTEAIRQLTLLGHGDALAALQLVLAALDIDEEVFRQQMKVIGKLPIAPVVLVTKDDRALDISRLLATDRRRLGSLSVDGPVVREQALQQGANRRYIRTHVNRSPKPRPLSRLSSSLPEDYGETNRTGQTQPTWFELARGAAIVPAAAE